MDIVEFYKTHKVDDDFDEVFYSEQYPETKDFYQPYCKNNSIDDRLRLFFHYFYYGSNKKKNKNDLTRMHYKPASIYLDRQVSVVLGCMNREDMLNISIHSWIKHDPIKEIIITDWSSDKSIKHLENISPKIKVIRVEGNEYYNASTPVNIAIKAAKYPIILKLDVDYIINPYGNFNDLINISEDDFICGNWKDKDIDNDLGFVRGTNGFLCVYKKHIETVGYYDQSIENYGIEDCQMFQKLLDIGLKRKTLSFTPYNIPIYHNPHSNFYRTENFEQKDVLYNSNIYNPIQFPKSSDGPNFIIAGFQKCGTTALRDILIENYPDHIHIPDCLHTECEYKKEIDFFKKNSTTKNLGIDWYKYLFDPTKISGEKSPSYVIDPDYSAKLIKRHYPNIKLIFCLRNPVDRAYSAYNHYKQIYPESKGWSWDNDLSFMENFNERNCGFKTLGLYARKICFYLKYFDFTQMHFVIQEKLNNQETFQNEFAKIVHFLKLPGKENYIYLQSHNRNYEEPLGNDERLVLSNFYKPHNKHLYQLIEREILEWQYDNIHE
jgi:hypothetical protein